MKGNSRYCPVDFCNKYTLYEVIVSKLSLGTFQVIRTVEFDPNSLITTDVIYAGTEDAFTEIVGKE